ncbi:MAG: hypothetical protein ACOYOA_07280 [Saprospiraceae bacterium]
MKQTLKNSTIYFLFWMFYYSIDRIFSLFYHYSKTQQIRLSDLLGCFWNGWRMDASISAYLSVFPFLLFMFPFFSKTSWVKPVLATYTYILLFVHVVICLADRG